MQYRTTLLSTIVLLAASTITHAQTETDTIKDHRTTEIYEPVPPVVTPAAKFGEAPSDRRHSLQRQEPRPMGKSFRRHSRRLDRFRRHPDR
ncbi:hypothetical protein ACQ86N_27250 [Puia sp. P3]|uniref:hypothetical protein n=1 Tax=Puia sp. P3 TaxID=3423952 RepID=UPI003D6709F2